MITRNLRLPDEMTDTQDNLCLLRLPDEIPDIHELFNLANADPPFKITFKMMISNYRKFKTSIFVEGERVQGVVQEIYQHANIHRIYWSRFHRAHATFASFLEAVWAAAKEPPNQVSTVYGEDLPDRDYDVWLTIEMGQNLKAMTMIETSDRCSQAMVRVLTEGTVNYDMTQLWDRMKDIVYYVFFCTYLPLCKSKRAKMYAEQRRELARLIPQCQRNIVLE